MERSRTGPKSTFSNQTKNLEGKTEYSLSPDPVEIVNTRLSAEKYQGLKVRWDLTISNTFYEISRDEIMVLTSYKNHPESIWLKVNVSEYPDILYLAQGRVVIVKAEIQNVQGEDIYLDHCTLKPTL